MEYIADRITIDDDLCNGKPTITRTRLTVSTVLEFINAGDTKEEVLYHYPSPEQEDIEACLRFQDLQKQN
ncbi:MAG: DUF433 domain-containing protein [Flavobacterium sp.]|nr:DUF433 domain-containing protein [Flavobacterium sp.]